MRLYDYPLSGEFQAFLVSTRERIEALIAEVDRLRALLASRAALAEIRKVEVAARISRLEYELKSLEARGEDTSLVVIHEPFVDNRSCDTEALAGTEAEVVPSYGMLVLRRRTSQELSVGVAWIVSGNGLPGNAHQVYPESGLFHAREGLHASLSYLADGNADTWFEYEAITGLPGYRYRGTAFADGTQWLTFDTRGLAMELELEVTDPGTAGGIVIDPFALSATGYRAPYLVTAMVDDGRGMRQRLSGALLDRTRLIACLPQRVRTVQLAIKQEAPYRTWVGIPATPLPASAVGLRYDPFTGRLQPPEYDASSAAPSEVAIIEEYFSDPATEVLPALRFAMALRQVGILAHTYEASSEYVSRPYQIPGGVKTLQVDVNAVVPEALTRERLVKVSASVDDGATWYYIAGSDAEAEMFGLPRRLAFEGYLPDYLKAANTLYLPGRPDGFRVRIELARPQDMDLAEYLTPAVTDYTVVAEQEGDAS